MAEWSFTNKVVWGSNSEYFVNEIFASEIVF